MKDTIRDITESMNTDTVTEVVTNMGGAGVGGVGGVAIGMVVVTM